MKEQITPKAVREDYAPGPFVFEERSDSGDFRFAAWTSDVDQLKGLVYAVLEHFPEEVLVLFKTETNGESARDGRQRYSGSTTRGAVIEAFKKLEELIFHDGGSMVCVKRADNGDYFALDEHDTFFIYSSDRFYLSLCQQLGFEHRVNELISHAGHWHIRPGCEDQEEEFIRLLALEPVA